MTTKRVKKVKHVNPPLMSQEERIALIMRPIPNLRYTFVERHQTAKTWAGAPPGDSLLTMVIYNGRVMPCKTDNDAWVNNELTVLMEKLREGVGE